MTDITVAPLQKDVGPPLPTKVTDRWPDWSPSSGEPKTKLMRPEIEPSRRTLPAYKRPSRWPLLFSFFLFVIVPSVCAGYYFIVLASNEYASEFRFSVTQMTSAIPGVPPTTSTSSSSSVSSTISALVGSSSMTSGGSQNFTVVDYINSDQAVRDVGKTIDLQKIFSSSNIDYLARLDPDANFETLAKYWRTMVFSDYDPVTGVAFTNVRAFTPHDAEDIANRLVTLSEALLNEIEQRSTQDVLKASEDEVVRTRSQLAKAQSDLSAFRNQEGIIDPTQSIIPANVQQIGALESTLVQLTTQMNSNKQIAMQSPYNKVFSSQITAAQGELKRLESEVARTRRGNRVLSDVMGRFEKLTFDLQYQQGMAMAAMQAREQAYANAHAQHLFLTPYVQPVLPTKSTYPRRYMSTFYASLIALGLWIVLVLAKRGIYDHG